MTLSKTNELIKNIILKGTLNKFLEIYFVLSWVKIKMEMLFLDFQIVVFWFSKFYFLWEYLPKLLLGWVTTRSLSLRRFVALPKIVQGRLSTTPPQG